MTFPAARNSVCRRPHPEQGFRACIGILRLARSVGADRLDAAAERTLTIGTLTYSLVKSILYQRLERAAGTASPDPTPIRHPNIGAADISTDDQGKASC